MSIRVHFTSMCGELENKLFRLFCLGSKECKTSISTAIFLSKTKILRWFDLEFLMNKIARTNKSRTEVNLIRDIFLDAKTKRAFHLRSSSKKVCATHRIKFSDMLFVLDQRLQKRISIQIFLSFAKFVDSLIRENVKSKLRITFHRFWQLFLFKWLQSSFSWRKILVKH